MNKTIQNSFDKLKSAFESIPKEERFKGYDPFDGLNSPLIKNTFLGRNKWVRLAWLQFFKRSTINARPLVGIKKEENPQALAIFLLSYCKLYSFEKKGEYLIDINYLADRIIALQQTKWSGACWSYPFPWQARAFYQPANTPLIIPTAYCFNALLDAYELTGNSEYKETALSSSQFVINDLNRTYDGELFAFSYSPLDTSVVYNASLMASQMLARSYSLTKSETLKNAAELSVKFCINRQQENGSWTYGAQPFHQWIDNFHTGYNLYCLVDYANFCNDQKFDKQIENGFNYYLGTFFNEDGFSKYYNNQKFPLDINNAAQLIITLDKTGKLNENQYLIESVMSFAIENMQSKNGWFYYQKHKNFTNKIIYLRWSNSWMFYAFSLLTTYAKS